MSEATERAVDMRPSILRSIARSIEPAFPDASATLRELARGLAVSLPCEITADGWCATHSTGQGPTYCTTDVYVVETPQGFTESFDQHQIEVLERLGLIRHLRDDHIIQDGQGRGVGPLHRFYGPVTS